MSGSAPEGWPELASLVDALLDAAPGERPALIDRLSGGDPARRSELERLLAECEGEPELFRRPAAERFAALFDDDVARFPEALGARYRLKRQLARGGMATVFLAEDLKHGRDVAVKVVNPAVAAALGSDRFLREIEIVARLHHPHIVPLYDSGESDGSLYYVMPYEEGSSLRDRLARDGTLPIDDVVVIIRDACDALSHAHQRGIVHRDIKPDNVLLAGRRALVTDFGVARAATDATATHLTLGTPAYMAPEQVAGDASLDHRADIYSVGALAYELLAGRPPFTGATRSEVLSAQLNEAPVPIGTRRADVSPRLAALVMKCLEKRPADRWQSADEIVRELDAIAIAGTSSRRSRWIGWSVAAALVAVVALGAIARRSGRDPEMGWRERWGTARIERVTDFPGSEVDAAISRDGRRVAFLADRDSTFDAFVTEVGSGQFTNLTGGRLPELFNEDVRNIGFSPDGAQLWLRVAEIGSPASVALVPVAGGAARTFLPTAVTVAWSPDSLRLAYHEATPGDPIYVADRDGHNARRVAIAAPGVHNHHVTWSPDGRFLYFARGLPPDEMDVWRIRADGSEEAERITSHDSRVAYPVMLDDRTLFYTATANDGTGPWLYSMDVERRAAHRVSTSVEHYLSIAASAGVAGQPRRLVATVSNPVVNLWSVPLGSAVADERLATRAALPTARAAAPRFAPDSSLLYLASRGGADGVWRLSASGARELWKGDQGAVVGAVAVSPDGKSMCFPVRRQLRSTLYCTRADGTGGRLLAEPLDVRGAASWSPDGQWLAVAAREGVSVRVFKVHAASGQAVRMVDSVSSNPVWSPDGAFILYSGTPRARSVPQRAVSADGRPYPLPTLAVDRVGDSYRFIPGTRTLVVKLGGFRRQDLWAFDLATGERRRLTALRPGESLPRFDVSPDKTRIVFERLEEKSDVVLVELPPR